MEDDGGSQPVESLSTGIERRISMVNGMQQQMGDFASDLARLKSQCDQLKRERQDLRMEIAHREYDRQDLDSEIARLTSERDSLQIEYANLHEDVQFWRQSDAVTSIEVDQQGKTIRSLWLKEEKARQLEKQIEEMKNSHRKELEVERKVASTLRDRIGDLEQNIRIGVKVVQKAQMTEDEIEALITEETRSLQEKLDHLQAQHEDVRASLARETKKHKDTFEQLRQLRKEEWQRQIDIDTEKSKYEREVAARKRVEQTLRTITAERRSLQEQLSRIVEGTQKAQKRLRDPTEMEAQKLAAYEHTHGKTSDGVSNISSVLQPVPPNAASPHVPTSTTGHPTAPPNSSLPQSLSSTPTTSLAQRYVHLEESHRALKAAYDAMKTKYRADVQHWKEYRAVEKARQEIRQKKREERKVVGEGAGTALVTVAGAPPLPLSTAAKASPLHSSLVARASAHSSTVAAKASPLPSPALTKAAPLLSPATASRSYSVVAHGSPAPAPVTKTSPLPSAATAGAARARPFPSFPKRVGSAPSPAGAVQPGATPSAAAPTVTPTTTPNAKNFKSVYMDGIRRPRNKAAETTPAGTDINPFDVSGRSSLSESSRSAATVPRVQSSPNLSSAGVDRGLDGPPRAVEDKSAAQLEEGDNSTDAGPPAKADEKMKAHSPAVPPSSSVLDPVKPTGVKAGSGTQAAPPTGMTTPLQVHPGRVTRWLGGSKSLSHGELQGDTTNEDYSVMRTPNISPLVRDRMGLKAIAPKSVAPDSSLRRSALTRTVTAANRSFEGTLDSPTAGFSTPQSRKRKLDFEGMSDAERTAEKRRIAKLPAAERREIYAEYKGQGRYLPPESVRRNITDEYEIDPSKNGGMKHQYHDVVRNRDARKQMHGGDCECCKDYYAAVGPIPLFNQAPAWSDTAGPDETRNGGTDQRKDIENHQNRVSRHRETWRKGPTPPDYWKIGFPSTQDVDKTNAAADAMEAEKEAQMRREVQSKDTKWRKKA